jgi:chitinase
VTGGGSKKVIAYFPSWGIYARNFQISNIPASMLTHINYAFANLSADGQCVLGDSYADIDKFYPGDSWDAGALRGNFHQLKILKQTNPNLKVMISVGGWNLVE